MTDDVEIQWEVQFIWSMPGKQTPYVKTRISPSELNARTLAHQASIPREAEDLEAAVTKLARSRDVGPNGPWQKGHREVVIPNDPEALATPEQTAHWLSVIRRQLANATGPMFKGERVDDLF